MVFILTTNHEMKKKKEKTKQLKEIGIKNGFWFCFVWGMKTDCSTGALKLMLTGPGRTERIEKKKRQQKQEKTK